MTGSIRLRVRGPQGQATISIDSHASWSDLIHDISEKTGVADFDLKYGFPPQNLNTESIHGETKLSDLPIRLNGEQLIVSPRNVGASLSSPMSGSQTATISQAQTLPSLDQTSPPTHNSRDFPSKPLSLTRNKKGNIENDPPEIPVPQLEGVMVLRVMPDDNSCMFRALSSAVLGDALDGMVEMRSIVAQTIRDKSEFYTEGVLEKKPADYCRWIQRDDAWGGGIELAILSEHFDIEICSVDVQSLHVHRFNEGKPRRCILVYSGIHYDVCAVTPYNGADPGEDRKVFDVLQLEDEQMDGGALDAAGQLCKILQSRHYYTDTHGFSLKCNQCGGQGNGERWATAHAKQTGHMDFGEAD
jgi:ubiquitin thioesterase OTU1